MPRTFGVTSCRPENFATLFVGKELVKSIEMIAETKQRLKILVARLLDHQAAPALSMRAAIRVPIRFLRFSISETVVLNRKANS